MESVLLVLAMILLMFWPWYFLVEPLGESMKQVKVAYCGGYQDRSSLAVWNMPGISTYRGGILYTTQPTFSLL